MADIMPTPPEGIFTWTFRIALDGTFYRMQYRWNIRDTSWYLDIADDSGAATIRGVRLVIGSDILDPHKYLTAEGCPQGVLSVVDTSNQGLEAQREDLGVRVIVTYESVT